METGVSVAARPPVSAGHALQLFLSLASLSTALWGRRSNWESSSQNKKAPGKWDAVEEARQKAFDRDSP